MRQLFSIAIAAATIMTPALAGALPAGIQLVQFQDQRDGDRHDGDRRDEDRRDGDRRDGDRRDGDRRDGDRRGYDRRGYDQRGGDQRGYDQRGGRGQGYADNWSPEQHYRRGNYQARYLGRDEQVWRGRDNRYYCRRSDGTAGLIIGGLGGGVLGNALAPGGSKTLGTILGGGLGAVLGNSVDRNRVQCR